MVSASNSATPAALLAFARFRPGGRQREQVLQRVAMALQGVVQRNLPIPFRGLGHGRASPRPSRSRQAASPRRRCFLTVLTEMPRRSATCAWGISWILCMTKTAWQRGRKRGDGVDQCLELALGLMATHGRRRHAGDFRKLGDGFHPGGSTTVATIAAHGGVVGDFPQQGQGRVHVLLLVAFEQLHAHVVHHFARHAPVAEAPANMVDQFLVVTNQCGQQRRLGGIERHDAPRKGAWLRRMGTSVNEKQSQMKDRSSSGIAWVGVRSGQVAFARPRNCRDQGGEDPFSPLFSPRPCRGHRLRRLSVSACVFRLEQRQGVAGATTAGNRDAADAFAGLFGFVEQVEDVRFRSPTQAGGGRCRTGSPAALLSR